VPRILAVNNYPTHEIFQRLEDCLKENGSLVASIEWSGASATRFNSFDGVVLSGSPDMMSEARIQAKYRNEMDAILDSAVPVLGVCFGHQMMASAFGSEVVKDGKPVLGMVETTVLTDDPLFMGLPRSLVLLESRHEVVKSLPGDFRLVARSAKSKVATMKHEKRPLYGVQFHPERYTKVNPDGKAVTANFVRMLKR
jgi:GMP synthase (glutamine-hydrolysing)